MSVLAGTRSNGRSQGLRALGLFVAVWLNLAMAPCAMASEAAGDHDCPHCPPEQMQGHHDMHDGMAADMPCADGLADCMIDDDISNDGRAGQLSLKDAPQAVVHTHIDSLLPATPVVCEAPPRYASVHPGAPPPTYLVNCVFLD